MLFLLKIKTLFYSNQLIKWTNYGICYTIIMRKITWKPRSTITFSLFWVSNLLRHAEDHWLNIYVWVSIVSSVILIPNLTVTMLTWTFECRDSIITILVFRDRPCLKTYTIHTRIDADVSVSFQRTIIRTSNLLDRIFT